MNKLTVIGATGPEGLEDLTSEELSLKETLDAMLSGEVILMTTYDNRREKDILIRVKESEKGLITQVSKPSSSMSGFVGNKKYWSMYDIDINSLSMYPTYVFDPSRYDIGYEFEPNSMVVYKSSYGDKDVAVVVGVLRDQAGNFYYKLSGEGERVFKEEELKELKK